MNAATETKTPEAAKPQATKVQTVTCDLHNPTKARRTIYDGIPDSMKPITVDKNGGVQRGVTISKQIADELRARNKAKPNSDLLVKPQAADAEEPTES